MAKRSPLSQTVWDFGTFGRVTRVVSIANRLLLYTKPPDAPGGPRMDTISRLNFIPRNEVKSISPRFPAARLTFCAPYEEPIICRQVGHAMAIGFISPRNRAGNLSRYGRSRSRAAWQ